MKENYSARVGAATYIHTMSAHIRADHMLLAYDARVSGEKCCTYTRARCTCDIFSQSDDAVGRGPVTMWSPCIHVTRACVLFSETTYWKCSRNGMIYHAAAMLYFAHVSDRFKVRIAGRYLFRKKEKKTGKCMNVQRVEEIYLHILFFFNDHFFWTISRGEGHQRRKMERNANTPLHAAW